MDWSLRSVQVKPNKTGARMVRHARCMLFSDGGSGGIESAIRGAAEAHRPVETDKWLTEGFRVMCGTPASTKGLAHCGFSSGSAIKSSMSLEVKCVWKSQIDGLSGRTYFSGGGRHTRCRQVS